jgi:hypothetical protein
MFSRLSLDHIKYSVRVLAFLLADAEELMNWLIDSSDAKSEASTQFESSSLNPATLVHNRLREKRFSHQPFPHFTTQVFPCALYGVVLYRIAVLELRLPSLAAAVNLQRQRASLQEISSPTQV